MPKPKLTILTDPVPDGSYFYTEPLYRISRKLKNFLLNKKNDLNIKYRGHYSVTRSLVEGLNKINASFNYNPSKLAEISDTVHVVSGVRALRQMIDLKKKGLIKKLYTGPNIVMFSTEYNSIILSPEIDGLINHCEFACKFWAFENPLILSRCILWPAGVDTEYWKPYSSPKKDSILIFDKRSEKDEPQRTKPYLEYLQKLGWKVNVLVRDPKNSYTHKQYLELLQQSELMIGFTVGSESQGIAWAEAWSTDVPTLILENTSNVFRGRRFDCSTAPFLTSETGLFFNNFEDFKIKLEYFYSNRHQFKPRTWTLKNMSDEVCAEILFKRLLSTIN